MEGRDFPTCMSCTDGNLLPLSDFGSQGAAIHYKAWVCSNPDCGFNIKIRNGDVYLNEPIANGEMHSQITYPVRHSPEQSSPPIAGCSPFFRCRGVLDLGLPLVVIY